MIWTPAVAASLGTIAWLIYSSVKVATASKCDAGLRTSTVVIVCVAWGGLVGVAITQCISAATDVRRRADAPPTHAIPAPAGAPPQMGGIAAARMPGAGRPLPSAPAVVAPGPPARALSTHMVDSSAPVLVGVGAGAGAAAVNQRAAPQPDATAVTIGVGMPVRPTAYNVGPTVGVGMPVARPPGGYEAARGSAV